MAKGARYKKYSRRASSRSRSGNRARSRALPVIIAVIAFLALCLIISVAVGLALGKKAERLAGKEKGEIAFGELYSGGRETREVEAYLYGMDYDISNIWRALPDFSFCLLDSDGGMDYDPELGFLPSDAVGGDPLREHTEYIKEYGGYICGYICVSSLSAEDGSASALGRAFELALIKKASESGVDEIMLIFPEIDGNNIDAVEKYVSDAASASDSAAVGVLLSPEILKMTDGGVYYASRLRAVCDFAAIDLREADIDNIEGVLLENEYYITSYSLRGVFNHENTAVADKARELGLNDTQIVEVKSEE